LEQITGNRDLDHVNGEQAIDVPQEFIIPSSSGVDFSSSEPEERGGLLKN
jgi:hypothetical protein